MQILSLAWSTWYAIDRSVISIVDQWDVQEVIKRVVAELQRRKYLVWFDRKRPHSRNLASFVPYLALTVRAASYSGVHEGQRSGWYGSYFTSNMQLLAMSTYRSFLTDLLVTSLLPLR